MSINKRRIIAILIIKKLEKNSYTIIKVVGNKQQNIMKAIKKDCKNKLKVNIGNYLMKKIYKKGMWKKYI